MKACAAGLSAFENYLFGFAIDVPAPATLVSFGAIAQANGTWNLALYSDKAGKPDKRVAQTGDQALTAYGGATEIPVASTAISAGTYWLMMVRHSSQGAICITDADPEIMLWQATGVTGAPPATYPSSSAATYQKSWNLYVTLRMPGL